MNDVEVGDAWTTTKERKKGGWVVLSCPTLQHQRLLHSTSSRSWKINFNSILRRANSHLYWQSFPRDLERCQRTENNRRYIYNIYPAAKNVVVDDVGDDDRDDDDDEEDIGNERWTQVFHHTK